VLRGSGAEAEVELAFVGLQKLLRPVLDRLSRLPAPQAETLRSARLERAIGVVYRPETERQSHYLRTRVADQVGERDRTVLALNRTAMQELGGETSLEIVPAASHLFEEPGAWSRSPAWPATGSSATFNPCPAVPRGGNMAMARSRPRHSRPASWCLCGPGHGGHVGAAARMRQVLNDSITRALREAAEAAAARDQVVGRP
jgi:hypothetical protein